MKRAAAGWWNDLTLTSREFRLTADSWLLVSFLLVTLLLIPLASIGAGLLQPGGEVWDHVSRNLLPRYFGQTILLLVGTGGLALLAGVSTAWLISSYEFPNRRFFRWALVLPLALPSYIAAFAYAGLLDYTGPVQQVGRSLGFSWNIDILSLPGVTMVLAAVLYPYIYLITRTAFANQSGHLLESARLMGRSEFDAFRRVALPVARPAVAGGLTLVLMETLNDYGAVRYYGVDTLTTGIFRAWFSMGDSSAAIRLAAVLMVITFGLLYLERLQRGRARYSERRAVSQARRRTLSGWPALIAWSTCLVPFVAGFVVPVGQLIYWLVIAGVARLSPQLPLLVTRTFLLAAGAALLTTAAAVLVIYTARLHRGQLTDLIRQSSILGYSIPGAVIAVGVLVPSAALDRLLGQASGVSGLFLTGSLAALLFAYLVRFMAVGHNATQAGFEKTCGSIDEAARSLGAGKLSTLWRINLPLLKGTLLSAFLLVFVDVVKELPLTLILRPFNFDTLATRVFELAVDEQVAESAAGALIIVLTSLIPILLLNRLQPERRSE